MVQRIRQNTSPIRLKALLARMIREEEQLKTHPIENIEDMPTQKVEAVRPSTPQIELPVQLPLDGQGRPYLQVNNPYESTHGLIESAVEQFHAISGRYPTIILLSALRYLEIYQFKCYYPRTSGAQPIPYGFERGSSYEILCRGDVWSV